MFNLVKNRIWLFTVLFCLLVVIYGYIAGLYIKKLDWYQDVYNSKFVSIAIDDIGIITLLVTFFVLGGSIFSWLKLKNKLVITYKAVVSIGLFSIAFWYFFDALKRVFVTLPDVSRVIVGDAFTIIYTMMIFEVVSSFIMMYCSFRIILSITEKSKGKDVLKIVNLKTITKLSQITRIASIAVAVMSIGVFIIFNVIDKYYILQTPYKGFGPMANFVFFIFISIALQYITRFFRSIKRQGQQKRIKTHRTVIILLFIMCGILGSGAHETMVLFNDNLLHSGVLHHTTDVWVRIGAVAVYLSIIGIVAICLAHITSIIMYAIEFSE